MTRLFRAPGRVNLIGEHTDYNDGVAMPVALDISTWARASWREDRRLQIYSENFDEQVEVDLGDAQLTAHKHWSDYPIGVVVMLERAGHRLHGARLEIRGEVPIGSGLSSSAAIEVAAGGGLGGNSGLGME